MKPATACVFDQVSLGEIMLRLDRSFVTPLDREDIHGLATALDNVVDLMDGTARRAQMFNLTDRREPMKQLAAVLVEATVLIKEAVHKVRQPAEVARIGRAIKTLEEQGDALYSDAVAALFKGTPDALEVIKWKELYDNVEHALDECEDVLNVALMRPICSPTDFIQIKGRGTRLFTFKHGDGEAQEVAQAAVADHRDDVPVLGAWRLDEAAAAPPLAPMLLS